MPYKNLYPFIALLMFAMSVLPLSANASEAEKNPFQGFDIAIYDEISDSHIHTTDPSSDNFREIVGLRNYAIGGSAGYTKQFGNLSLGANVYYSWTLKREVESGNDITYAKKK